MALFALVVFWTCVSLMLLNVGWRPAFGFAAMWIFGFCLYQIFELHEYMFIGYGGILTVAIVKWKKPITS